MQQEILNQREIRVFLSSTFRDMDAERTYLVKQVFPKVRAACLERQVGFSEIDLRWGVSEEESKNGATVEICLKEIDRCRDFPPFFIGFLGERYGWVPRHDELAAYWEQHSDSEYAKAILNSIERGISVTELEMELAVLEQGAAKKIADHALFCLRDAKLTDLLYQAQTGKAPDRADPAFYDAGKGKLNALKDKIRRSGFLGLDNYTTVEQFGSTVENYLLGQLDRYFPADEIPTPLQRTNAAHAAFRFHRLQNFLPRTDVREQMVKAIEQRIESPHLGPILVTGPSGQGKSALMADLARHLQNNERKTGNKDNPDETWRVIDHYIGADSANYLDGWIDRILNILHPDIKDIAGDIPESHKDKIEALSTWISMAARRHNCRYLFILDALDQLNDGGKNLDILTPQTLGPDGILIASAADGTPARESAAQWQTMLEVPPLTNELKEKLIHDTLDRYRKKLPSGLAAKLAHAPQNGSPLFLILSLEELRVDARHETLAPTTDAILKQPDAEHLFLNHFLLDADNGRPELPELAASFMALLGASRAGLSEIELADLLAQPDDPTAEDTGKPRLPQVYLSKLLNNLAPFLLNKQGRRAPMHRVFGEVALNYYGTWPVREHLYAHFSPGYGKGENEYDARGAAEALHQILKISQQDLTQKPRLEADIAHLPIPVALHDEEEELLFEVLNEFSYDDKTRLGEDWQAQARQTLKACRSEEDLDVVVEPIGSFASWISYRVGHHVAARGLQELILKMCQRLLGNEHLDTIRAVSGLSISLSKMGELKGARVMEEKVLAMTLSILGEEHPVTITAMGNLAASLSDMGELEKGRVMEEKVLAMTLNILGEDHPDTLRAMNNLAISLSDMGELEGARVMWEKTLALRQRILGEEHPDTLGAMNNLANSLSDMDDLNGARELREKVFKVRCRILGEEHPDTLIAMGNLAVSLSDMGELKGARAMEEKVFVLRQRILGEEHPDTISAMDYLATSLSEMGDLEDALAMRKKVLALRQRILGEEHPDTLIAMGNLAISLSDMGDLEDALAMRKKVLALRQHILGEEHRDTISAMASLAYSLAKMGELDGARAMFEKVLALRQRIFGEDHPSTIKVMNNLAKVLAKMGELDGARAMFEKILALRQCILGEDHPDTIQAMGRLGNTVGRMGYYEKAGRILRRGLELGGENENATFKLRYDLACFECLSGNWDEAKRLVVEYLGHHPEALEQFLEDADLAAIHDEIRLLAKA